MEIQRKKTNHKDVYYYDDIENNDKTYYVLQKNKNGNVVEKVIGKESSGITPAEAYKKAFTECKAHKNHLQQCFMTDKPNDSSYL